MTSITIDDMVDFIDNNDINSLEKNLSIPLINDKYNNSGTLLYYACKYNNIEIVKVLLSYIILTNQLHVITINDHDGNNIMHIICSYGTNDMLKLFLENPNLSYINEILINSLNNYGNTILYYAIKCNNVSI